MTAEAGTKRGLTGWHVLFIVGLAFAMVLAVNITFITLAITTFTGEDVPDAYDRGLAYNDIIEERAEQAALGWTASLGAALDESGAAHVTVNLTDADGAPISGATVTMLFRRSTHEGEDTSALLTDAGDGTYEADVALPGAGLWDVRGRADRDEGERLDFEDRLWLE